MMCLYAFRYKAYVQKLSPSQLESIKALKRKRSEDKAKRLSRRDKKRESEDLGKPKYPGNAFFLYISTLERGDLTGKVCHGFLLRLVVVNLFHQATHQIM